MSDENEDGEERAAPPYERPPQEYLDVRSEHASVIIDIARAIDAVRTKESLDLLKAAGEAMLLHLKPAPAEVRHLTAISSDQPPRSRL